MALLVSPIKADLDINDVQFGLLHGLAFALLYSVMGVPSTSTVHTPQLVVSQPMWVPVSRAMF